jgi:methyl-accepting chemotaxis protein
VKALIEQSGSEVKRRHARWLPPLTAKLAAIHASVRDNQTLMEGIASRQRRPGRGDRRDHRGSAADGRDDPAQRRAGRRDQCAIEQTEQQAAELDRIVEVFQVAEQVPGGLRRAA